MLSSLISALFNFLFIAMIGRVLLSWFNISPSSSLYPIVTILHQVTEPILAPIRRVLPRFGMLDLSPMVAIILLTFVRNVIVSRL